MKTFDDVGKAFRVMGEFYGKTISDGAARMIAGDLEGHDPEAILEAMQACRRELARFPTIADIISRIDSKDGRPGAEQAWALLPKDESVSAAITTEMQEAYGVVHDHIKNSDYIAGRMAFIEVYNRLVRETRERNQKVKWVASYGTDPGQREKAQRDADSKNGVSRAALPAPKTEPRVEDIPVDPNASVKIKALLSRITRPLPEEEK